MRLLRIEADGGFSLVEYVGKSIPPYAILSHTWGADHEEVTARDIVEGLGKSKEGYRKLTFCGKRAANDGLQYFWVDTCCIDKSSSAELSEAINSMFQWYHKADKCYAYLVDVSIRDFVKDDQTFQRSKWFTRGWTLQELLAPTSVEFFTQEGDRLGDRDSLISEITSITGIPVTALQGTRLAHFSVEIRRSWLRDRQTKREEDAAYCLLGIFDVFMPLIYGEGRDRAFLRLWEEINKPFYNLSSALSSQALLTEPINRTIDLPFTAPGSPNSEITEQSDMSSFKAKGNNLKRKIWTDEYRMLHKRRKEVLNFQIGGQGREATLNRFRDTDNDNDFAVSRLHKNIDGRDRLLPHSTGMWTEKMKDRSKPALLISTRSELDNTSISDGLSVDQAKLPQRDINILSRLASFIDFKPHLFPQSTQIGDYFIDEQRQDHSESLSNQRSFRLLVDMERESKVQSQNTINRWLGVTNLDEQHNVTQYYDKQTSSHLEGTCNWIFTHPAYESWISENKSSKTAKILWICAPAGYGKTILCARLVEYLKALELFPMVYFFASPHAQTGGDPSFILRSWISQVAQLDSEILEVIQEHLEAGQKTTESYIWSIFALIVSGSRNYTFILDGFDEYSRQDGARTIFLQKLKEVIKGTMSRVLITSRNETDIEAELSPTVAHASEIILLQCKITKAEIWADISLFSKCVVDEKLPKKDDHLRQDLAEQLAEKCQGMFLWIRLQKDQLRGSKNTKQLQNIVRNMPIGLEKTYERNWNTLQNHCPADRDRALDILRWVTFAFRPLTVVEITEALIVGSDGRSTVPQWDDLPDNIDEEYINSEIIDICGGLVETRAEKPGIEAGLRSIHLIHPSVREFLLPTLSPHSIDMNTSYLQNNQASTRAEQHEYLATICLGYLNHDDTWQRYKSQKESTHEHGFLDYAARNWNHHFLPAEKYSTRLLQLVEEFFRSENRNFNQWSVYIEPSDGEADDEQRRNEVIATPMYYAALLGLTSTMKYIWTKDATQLNKTGGEFGTPLQAACFKGHESAFQQLLSWGADYNTQGGRFGAPINAAIAGGQTSMVEALIRMEVDHTLRDILGRTAVFIAAETGYPEIMKKLLEKGADVTVTNNNGWTPLNAAANNGHIEVIKLLLEKDADITVATKTGWAPLNSAADSGQTEIVKLLLQKGADITVASNSGWTPLNAAADSGHFEVVKMLLQKGADIEIPNNGGETPLFSAVSNNHLEVAKLLIEEGADTAVVTNSGVTPLIGAAVNGSIEMVTLLVEQGADISASVNGIAALNITAFTGNLDLVTLLLEMGADIELSNIDGGTPLNAAACGGHIEMVNLLLDKGATIADASNTWTPLHSAAECGHAGIVKILMEKGADITVASNTGWTPLNAAANHGHVEVVKLLIEKGADPAVANNNGWTPLNSAAGNGHVEVVQLLINKGADSTVANNNGWTPLNAAAGSGHVEVVQLLLEQGVDATIANTDGLTPLNSAAGNGHVGVIRLLLEKGADVAVASNSGWTPLNAAAGSCHVEAVQLLLERGADTAIASSDGWTPLNSAAGNGHVEVVQLLLDKGADITAANNNGWTPLNSAANNGHVEVIRLLLEKGADATVASNGGWTPLNAAADNGHVEAVQLLLERGTDTAITSPDGWTPLNSAAGNDHVEVVQLLLDKGADPTFANNNGWTPLNSAANSGHIEVVRLLLEKGADLNIANNKGLTPLNAAAGNGYVEVVKLLIEKGADPAIADSRGWTPLSAAAVGGHIEVVKLLIERGDDSAIANNSGWTPLNVAAAGGHVEVVQLLLEHGADATVANNNGWTPLHASAEGSHVKVVKLLIEMGASLDIADKNGWTPLNVAAGGGHVEVVQLLLEHGADATVANNNGWAPFNGAAYSGHIDVVKLLLERGAYSSCKGLDRHYGTIFNLLAWKGYTELLKVYYEQWSKSDVYLADIHGRSPLQFAARGGHSETFQYLISQGLDPNKQDVNGDDILSYVASSGSLKALLTVWGLGIQSRPRVNHWGPLHWACRAGVFEVVDSLIKKGLEAECVTVPEIQGKWSPLSIAIFHGNEDMLGRLSASQKSLLGIEGYIPQTSGTYQGGVWCNKCLHDIYGTRYHCRTCKVLDYCFMCKPFLENLHTSHEWEVFEACV